MAELCARKITAPHNNRAINMGTSHHLLCAQQKENNSPTIPKRPVTARAALITPMMILLRNRFHKMTRYTCGHPVAEGWIEADSWKPLHLILQMGPDASDHGLGYDLVAPRSKVRLIYIQRFPGGIE